MLNRAIRFCMIMMIIGVLAIALPTAAQDDDTTPQVYDPVVCDDAAESDSLSAECLAMIEAFPRPDFQRVNQDRTTLGTYSFWRVGPQAVNTHDAPGGNVIGQIPQGFNFVNAIDTSVAGWLQIEGGEWISRENATFSDPSYFTGVELDEWTGHEFAWVLDLSNIFVSEYPGGPASQETGRFLQRYEIVYIYDTAVDDEGWRWYMIGPDQWVKQIFVAKIQPTERPDGVSGRWVAIDLYEQTLIAYENDTPVFATLVATGLPGTETNEGVFEVWASLERDGMSGSTGAPNAYALQSVPWVLYFDNDISIHGTYWHDLFGYRQSRGCVNLTISDARYVYEWFANAPAVDDVNDGSIFNQNSGEIVNYVYVHSTGEFGSGVTRDS